MVARLLMCNRRVLKIARWPITTIVGESFTKLESKWPNYFLFEPGFHFGYKF